MYKLRVLTYNIKTLKKIPKNVKIQFVYSESMKHETNL